MSLAPSPSDSPVTALPPERERLHQSIDDTCATLETLKALAPQIEAASDLILSTLRHGGKLLIGGNGGSAAEASHFATELTGRYHRNRAPLPAISLSADGSLITCIGNDFGFEEIFARPIRAFAQSKDLVVLISSSGNSRNVLHGLAAAQAIGASTLSLLGCGGGLAHHQATVELTIPGSSGRTAQEAHLFLIHHFCDQIDAAFA